MDDSKALTGSSVGTGADEVDEKSVDENSWSEEIDNIGMVGADAGQNVVDAGGVVDFVENGAKNASSVI